MHLTWSAVVATYKREHILPLALYLAAHSTRAPKQIIVIDASPNWEQTRQFVYDEVASKSDHIEWIYRKADVTSLTHQRNQGIGLTESDLVFFIDDDSLMYPSCAEEIVRVFEKDTGEKVTGAGPMLAAEEPEVELPERLRRPSQANLKLVGKVPTRSRLKKFLRRILEGGDVPYLLPYDGDWPNLPIPSELDDAPIIRAPSLIGCGMCFRRDVVIKEPFETVLLRYAYLEDADMSYRASRHGAIVKCTTAKICHLETFGGRLPPFVVAFIGAMNPAVLHSLYSNDKERSRVQLKRQMWRRLLFLALRDLSAGRITVPSARGVREAIKYIDLAFGMSEKELRDWYPKFQLTLFQ